MSARPEIASMPEAELELLLSRAIDGDLSPDEERDLQAYLAAHPEARARAASMEAVVARLKELPAPEPPFALATRVTSQVAERSRGLGAVGHRFGLFLPPGLLAAGVGVIALGAVLASFLTRPSQKETAVLAKKDEGPVRVFFQEAAPSKPAGSVAAQNAPASRRDEAKAEAKAKPAPPEREKAIDEERVAALKEAPAETQVASAEKDAQRAASSAFAPEQGAGAPAAVPRDDVAPAPAAPAPALAMAPESRAGHARAAAEPLADETSRPLGVSLVSGSGWRVAPATAPPSATGTHRLALDEKGRVVRVVKGTADAAAERFLLSLSFERTGGPASSEVEVRIAPR